MQILITNYQLDHRTSTDALEMYKPAPQRKRGHYALPILYGDRLVGKLNATFDRHVRQF